MAETSLRAFAPEPLNPIPTHTDEDQQPMVEPPAKEGGWLEAFIQDVENIVCGEINDGDLVWRDRILIGWNGRSVKVTPALISGAQRRKPLAMARRWCWWILYNHPYAKSWATWKKIAGLYGRDHTTVGHGLMLVQTALTERPAQYEAQALRKVIAAVCAKYGAMDHLISGEGNSCS